MDALEALKAFAEKKISIHEMNGIAEASTQNAANAAIALHTEWESSDLTVAAAREKAAVLYRQYATS